MTGATTERDDALPTARKSKHLRREALGLLFVYALFAVVCGVLAGQCVERPEPPAPSEVPSSPGR